MKKLVIALVVLGLFSTVGFTMSKDTDVQSKDVSVSSEVTPTASVTPAKTSCGCSKK